MLTQSLKVVKVEKGGEWAEERPGEGSRGMEVGEKSMQEREENIWEERIGNEILREGGKRRLQLYILWRHLAPVLQIWIQIRNRSDPVF